MPTYESNLPHEEMQKVIDKGCVCLECGAPLSIAWGGFYGHNEYMLRCGNDPKHDGIARDASLSPYDIPGFNLFNLNRGRKKRMVQEHGAEKTKALDRYRDTVSITKRVATDIVETLWGDAPMAEKTKCILLCQTYQLNPLMKHIYLIGYKHYKDRKLVVDNQGQPVLDWSIQIGIGATRLLAQRKHNYSYLDMTPRKATKAEIEKILGDTANPECIYGFVHIKDVDTGAEAFGLRGIAQTDNIKGIEKGNTHLNMACIRAERLALDRQYPGEMPQGLEVIDERFIEPEYKVVNNRTGEITESASQLASEPEPEPEPGLETREHWCAEHNCQFDKKVRGSSIWYAHKLDGGKWCNEKDKAKPEPEPLPEPTESKTETKKVTRDLDAIKTLNDLYKACNTDFKNAEGKGMQPEEVIAELGVSSQSDISDTPADCYSKIAAVR